MTQESWGHWRPRFRSGGSVDRVRAWYRRVECPSCGAVAGRSCRTSSGYPTDHHRSRRDAAGDPPYRQWREQGLIKEPRPAASSSGLVLASHEASTELRVDGAIADAVALVRRFLADRSGLFMEDEAVMDRLDQDVRGLLLARGPERSAEFVTVLVGHLAGLVTHIVPDDPETAYTQMVAAQVGVARELQLATKHLREQLEEGLDQSGDLPGT